MYTAIVISESEQKLLLDYLKILKIEIPKDWELLAHHVTLNMGRARFPDRLGKMSTILVTDFASNDKVMAVRVHTGEDSVNSTQHITLAVNRKKNGKPVMSNNLTDWKPLDFTFGLAGEVREVK